MLGQHNIFRRRFFSFCFFFSTLVHVVFIALLSIHLRTKNILPSFQGFFDDFKKNDQILDIVFEIKREGGMMNLPLYEEETIDRFFKVEGIEAPLRSTVSLDCKLLPSEKKKIPLTIKGEGLETLIDEIKEKIKLSYPFEKKEILQTKPSFTEERVELFFSHRQRDISRKNIAFTFGKRECFLPLTEIDIEAPSKKGLRMENTLPFFPLLSDLNAESIGDNFDVDISYFPQEEGNYIFAITLIPKQDVKFERLNQNLFFIIDKSNSIQKNRLTSVRHAMIASFTLLQKGDSFNIVTFDNKIEQLSDRALKVDFDSIASAKEFLFNQTLASFFTPTNMILPFERVLKTPLRKDEVNTVILLTDGNEFSKVKNCKILQRWTQINQGAFSLFSIVLNSDKNKSFLDVFSFLNKGSLVVSPSQRGIKRKLLRLLKSISFPIAKDLKSFAVALSDDVKVDFSLSKLPNLYLGQPYVIMGTVNKLDDFALFIQGKGKGRWLNLKKQISFSEAKQELTSLLQQWVIQRSYSLYENYFITGNPLFLKEAKRILEPFDIKTAF